MNKKFLIFGVVGLFVVGLVAAIGYYAIFSTSFNVLSSISIDGETEQDLGEVYDGQTIYGDPITLTNEADNLREITISDDAGEGIITSYLAKLSLTKKDTSTWVAVGEPIEITYTVVGNDFEVTGVPEGYSLIYYKDAEENTDDEDRLLTIGEIGLTNTNLPHSDDWNWGDLANYCDLANGYDDYNQCKGAKLWLVETSDIVEDDLNWANMANYYYELDLIQYNAEGEITLFSGATLTLTPVYEIGAGVSGEQIVTTTVA